MRNYWPADVTRRRHVPDRGLTNTHRMLPDAGSMLGQRRRRWPNIEPALGNVSCLLGDLQARDVEPMLDPRRTQLANSEPA